MKKYILGLCAVAMFSMTSCYDLDQLPNDQVAVDFANTTQTEQVLVGVYRYLNDDWIFAGRYGWDNCSDIAWCSNGWWAAYDHYDIAHGNISASSPRNLKFSSSLSVSSDSLAGPIVHTILVLRICFIS